MPRISELTPITTSVGVDEIFPIVQSGITKSVPVGRLRGSYLSASDYGATGDGSTDDSTALQNAMQAASGQSKVLYLSGISGEQFAISTKLSLDIDTYPGIVLDGGHIDGVVNKGTGAKVIYSGADAAFSFTNGAAFSKGGIIFRNFLLECTNAAADGIEIDGDTGDVIRMVRLSNMRMWGAGQSNSVTGNAINLTKVFDVHIDELCQIRDWKRGVYANGADNLFVAGRFSNNDRHLHLVANSTYGNNNVIGPGISLLGTNSTQSDETQCHLYIDGNVDVVAFAPWFETANGHGFVYFDGGPICLYSPWFGESGGAKILHIADSAAECRIYNPRWTQTGTAASIAADVPASLDTGGSLQNSNLVIYDAPARFVDDVDWETSGKGRVKVFSEGPNKPAGNIPSDNLQVTANGVAIKSQTITSENFYRATGGAASYASIDSIVADTGAHGGNAIRLSTTNLSGFTIDLEVGKHVNEADVISVAVRYRLESALGSGTFRIQTRKNGANINNEAVGSSTSYAVVGDAGLGNFPYTLSGFADGDLLSIGLYTSAIDAFVRVDALEVTVA